MKKEKLMKSKMGWIRKNGEAKSMLKKENA